MDKKKRLEENSDKTFLALKDHEIIVYGIVAAASRYFTECPEDFCLQYQGENLVFGGWNRLTWSPAYGFSALYSHCTPEFVARYEQLGPHPREEE